MANQPPDMPLIELLEKINARSSKKYRYHGDYGQKSRVGVYTIYYESPVADDIGKVVLPGLMRHEVIDALNAIIAYQDAERAKQPSVIPKK